MWHSSFLNFDFSITLESYRRDASLARSRIPELRLLNIQWHKAEDPMVLLEKIGLGWCMSVYRKNNSEIYVVDMDLWDHNRKFSHT